MKRKKSAVEKSDIVTARKNGISRRSVAATSDIPYGTIQSWERIEAHPSKPKKRGRPRELSEKQTAELYSAVDHDDALTNTKLFEQL